MLKTLDEIRARIITSYDPDGIILFGSRATGTNSDESDYDLLIFKDTPAQPIDRRIEVETILQDRAVPLDILVYTPQEMNYLYSIGSPFIEEVIETGRLIYQKEMPRLRRKQPGLSLSASKLFFKLKSGLEGCNTKSSLCDR